MWGSSTSFGLFRPGLRAWVLPTTESSDHAISATIAVVGPLLEVFPRSEFTFVVNDATFTTSVAEAVELSPAVREQLSVDACARRFVISDSETDSAAFSSVQRLLSGVKILLEKKLQASLVLFTRRLCNDDLERLFFGLWAKSSDDIPLTRSRVDLHSISDLSLLSVDALDALLSSESFVVDSEDDLLQSLLSPQQPSLLRHVRLDCLSPAAPNPRPTAQRKHSGASLLIE
jgi:hypothetical protein